MAPRTYNERLADHRLAKAPGKAPMPRTHPDFTPDSSPTGRRTSRRGLRALAGLLIVLALLGFERPAFAQGAGESGPSASAEMIRGDYFFKSGNYSKAASSYYAAVVEKDDLDRLLAYANALFAIGNYRYTSHVLRRAVRRAGKGPLDADWLSRFPSPTDYANKVNDLKRFLTYHRRDPSALTVMAFLYWHDGEDAKCRRLCGYLKTHDRDDEMAAFLLARLEQRTQSSPAPVLPATPAPKPSEPAEAPQPAPKSEPPVKLPRARKAGAAPRPKSTEPAPAVAE